MANLLQRDSAVGGENSFSAQQFELPTGQMCCRPTGCGDDAVPGQVRRVGPHDPADDPGAGKAGGSCDVTISRDPAGRDAGHQCAHLLNLFVGDGRHGQLKCSRTTAATSAGRACATM